MKPSIIGKRLKMLREERELSQKEFAEFLNIPQPTLSTYENDRVVPTLDAIISIAQKCTVSLDWLCGISTRHSISTLGDVTDIYYQLLETAEIGFDMEISGDEDNIATHTVHRDHNNYKYNIPFFSMLCRVQKTFHEFVMKNMSKDYYMLAKERDCSYYDAIPLSKSFDLTA